MSAYERGSGAAGSPVSHRGRGPTRAAVPVGGSRSERTLGLRRGLLAWAIGVLLAASACGPRPDNSHVHLPAPVESTTIGPGDVVVIEIVGEPNLPKEFQVAPNGTVDLPYIHRVNVAGLEPQEVQEAVRQRLIAERYLTDPSVVVRVSAYNSKRVSVLGAVAGPDSFPLEPGLTLVQAISLAGGLNAIADGDRVKLTRSTRDGQSTVVVSVRAIMDGRSPDIPLQAGDQIHVQNRPF